MALRIRRDVQKASYYVWFLGAEEAKGLRGARVINSGLPYLIDRARSQEPLKITLQVSHKGIKILQGSSKHFIPHSAITSSVQIDDMVACVLLLYNPATKCPLHVHAYRCDSASTAEQLNQQLQTLINRPENQKRFEELESRLGIVPPTLAAPPHQSKELMKHKKQHFELKQQQEQRHHAQVMPPKRLGSSMGSDTGTGQSEGSEEHSRNSPGSHSPLIAKTSLPPAQCNDLFDSLAAELRAKLNGNGPPLLLPPRDYDTVHRSKGNLTAIELRRCRNSLIVGGPNAASAAALNAKQVSSRGSSGIGSDLAPSPERQDINSSSDEEHWSNEADNSVIALKPSQIAMDRAADCIAPCHAQLSRRNNVSKLSEDSYLRDLPVKPYVPREPPPSSSRDRRDCMALPEERDSHLKLPSTSYSWSREDEIKPVIVRPADYDAKLNRILQADQKYNHARNFEKDKKSQHRMLAKGYSIERRSPDDFINAEDEQDAYIDDGNAMATSHGQAINRKERKNIDLQRGPEQYHSKKPPESLEFIKQNAERQRYNANALDFAYDQPGAGAAAHNKYAAVHHRAVGGPERQRDLQRDMLESEGQQRRDVSRKQFPRTSSHDRNPYRESESIPYIQSMEKMMKTCEIRYKSFENVNRPGMSRPYGKGEPHADNDAPADTRAASRNSNISLKEHHHYPNDKFHCEGRYEGKDMQDFPDFRLRGRGGPGNGDVWSSDEQRREQSHSSLENERSLPREQWEYSVWPRPSQNATPSSRDQLHSVESSHPRDLKYRKPPTNMRMEHDRGDSRGGDSRGDSRGGDSSYQRYKRSESYSDSTDDYHHQQPAEYLQRQNHHPRQGPAMSRHREPQRELHISQRVFSPERDGKRMEFIQGKPYRKPSPSSHHSEKHPSGSYSPEDGPPPMANAKSLSNLAKGYRNSYADPVFVRPGGRVGLAAVNPY